MLPQITGTYKQLLSKLCGFVMSVEEKASVVFSFLPPISLVFVILSEVLTYTAKQKEVRNSGG
jgi:hypothetical protein